jgi:hypothetical protein
MISLKALRQTAKEFNTILGLNPPIDLRATAETLINDIRQEIEQGIPDEEFSLEVVELLKEIKDRFAKVEATDIPHEEVDPVVEKTLIVKGEDNPVIEDGIALADQIDNAKRISQLKEIVKSNDEFKTLRGKLGSFKTMDELRVVMIDLLAGEIPEGYVDQDQPTAPARDLSIPEPPPINDPKRRGPKSKTTQSFEISRVLKGLVVGSKVEFVTAANSRIAPAQVLSGKVIQIKIDISKTPEEVVHIKTDRGLFYKLSKNVKLL